MNPEELTSLKTWFAGYCASFSTPVQEDQQNLAVKQDHTHQVCLNSLRIGRDLNLNWESLLLAEAIALCHDVGRFPQYQRYKTFDDGISVNHAALGAKVISERKVLQGLPKPDQDLIIHAVILHNVFFLPENLDERTRLFTRLVRDADKLDIWRVFLEYYGQDKNGRATAVALGLPDTPGYSPKVLAYLQQGEMATKSDLKTLNDFKLLQLTWLYDINFASSLQVVLERGYIEKIAGVLPDNEELRKAVDHVRAYVNEKLAEG
jgi:hypothetical protein